MSSNLNNDNYQFFVEHDFTPLYNYHDKNICIEFNYDSLLYVVNLFTYLVDLCSVQKIK